MKTAFLYKSLKNKAVQCLACQHHCHIQEGKTGICGIRQNIAGQLELLVFGRAVAMNIDPIEKKPLYHFLPGSRTFSIGTFGCNFRCSNCQNFDISQILDQKGKADSSPDFNWGKKLSAEEAVRAAKDNNCQSIAYTYNEPTIWAEYALEIMKLAKKEGLFNVWVSNGYMTPETLEAVAPYLDAINIDIKSLADDFYRENCGAHLEPILENCRQVVKKNIHLEITTLIIPTLSDDEKMLKKLAEFIRHDLGVGIPWHISAFSGGISWKLQHLPETSVEKLKTIHQIGLDADLQYVYVGNVFSQGLDNTHCPQCSATVIERVGYNIENQLEKGKCSNCGYQVLNPR